MLELEVEVEVPGPPAGTGHPVQYEDTGAGVLSLGTSGDSSVHQCPSYGCRGTRVLLALLIKDGEGCVGLTTLSVPGYPLYPFVPVLLLLSGYPGLRTRIPVYPGTK
eukprot:2541394-Rhodomonas_salina.1